jgi:mycothiol synthase
MREPIEISTTVAGTDAQELLDLVAADSHTLRALPPLTRGALVSAAAHCHVARSGDRAVGLLIANRRESSGVLRAIGVRAEWRRRGVARALVESLAAELDAEGVRRMVTAAVDTRDAAAIAFFRALGWTEESTGSLQMRRDLDDLPPLPALAGYRLRTYREGDAEAWTRLLRDAFATEVGSHAPAGDDAFRRELGESPLFDPGRVFFAVREEDGQVAGTTSSWEAKIEGRRVGLIHWVAVAPAHRGHGLGEALNLAALHDMRARGHQEAYLNTNTALRAAVHLYERLGFRPAQGHRRAERGGPVVFQRPDGQASG